MNDTIIFLVLAGLALIFKWLTREGSEETKKTDGQQPNETAVPSRPPAESEQERVRRFLEALGVPAGTDVPPPIQRRRPATPAVPSAQKPKTKRTWVQPLPPLVTTPEDVTSFPPVEIMPPPLVTVEDAPPPVLIPTPLAPLAPTRPALAKRAAPATSLGAMLRAPGSARRAILLREILGPPRGLQPFDERSFL